MYLEGFAEDSPDVFSFQTLNTQTKPHWLKLPNSEYIFFGSQMIFPIYL